MPRVAQIVALLPAARPTVAVLVDGIWYPGEIHHRIYYDDGTEMVTVSWNRFPGSPQVIEPFPVGLVHEAD